MTAAKRPEAVGLMAVLGGALFISIGFATRDLLASLVAGVMIIFDRPFQVGDRVRFGGEYGDILAIGLRSVKLRTLDDSIVTIPNNLFLSEVAASSNAGALDMQVVVDFYIGIDQDADRAMKLVREAAAVVKGRQVASSIKLAMVVPGSGLVKRQAEQEGLHRIFLEAVQYAR